MKKDYKEKMVVQEWMTLALLELMKTYDYEAITIKQIAEKAGVSRMTFYRNYVTKDDILKSYSDYLTQSLSERYRSKTPNIQEHYWRILFELIKDNAEYMKSLVRSGKTDIILETSNKNILAYPENYRLTACCIAGASYNLIVQWIKNDFKESPEELEEIIKKFSDREYTEIISKYYIKAFHKL